MRLIDKNRIVNIEICRWNGNGYDPDWSADYFDAGGLPYDEENDAYIVEDVQYCIDMAEGCDAEGACCKWDEENWQYVRDEDMTVVVYEQVQ